MPSRLWNAMEALLVGWVMARTLSSRRTAVVLPWSKDETPLPLYDSDSEKSAVVARIQPNVLASIEECTGTLCHIEGAGYNGWMQQDKLWGAYPGEKVK